MFGFDPLYFLFALPGLIIALVAQFLVKIAYSHYSNISSGTNYSGVDTAKIISQGEGYNVSLQTTEGYLNDYFDPSTNIVNLSADNARSNSVANVAVVAHEFGHVQQKYSSAF